MVGLQNPQPVPGGKPEDVFFATRQVTRHYIGYHGASPDIGPPSCHEFGSCNFVATNRSLADSYFPTYGMLYCRGRLLTLSACAVCRSICNTVYSALHQRQLLTASCPYCQHVFRCRPRFRWDRLLTTRGVTRPPLLFPPSPHTRPLRAFRRVSGPEQGPCRRDYVCDVAIERRTVVREQAAARHPAPAGVAL